MNKNQNNVDIVITWVDGADSRWQQSRAEYRYLETGKREESRFRDQGTLKYLFRSIESYAPWVRKVHFVTCGQKPDWLNTAHPKLNLVNHSDYIPAEYLPTFSSHTIELNFHRIQGLSEQFVYFNDDTLLTAPVQPEDFFQNGMPCDSAVLTPVIGSVPGDPFAHYLLNNTALINGHFRMRQVLSRKPANWFNLKYGSYNLRNLMFSLGTRWFVGFKNFHMPAPMVKSSFEAVWNLEPELLRKTCQNKFRGLNDINPYVMSYYNFCTNRFVPRSPKFGGYLDLGQEPGRIAGALHGKYKYITINDSDDLADFDEAKSRMLRLLEEKYPQKSAFEI